MATELTVTKRLERLFTEELQVDVPSLETNLFETGILDSLKFVELLAAVERAFDIQIAVDEMELDDFRTVSGIARFLAGRTTTLRG